MSDLKTLGSQQRAKLRKLVDEVGLVAAAKALGLNKQTVALLVAAMPVRSGSLAVARLYLDPNKSRRDA